MSQFSMQDVAFHSQAAAVAPAEAHRLSSIMEMRPAVKSEMFTWKPKDSADYQKLIGLSCNDVTDKIASISKDGGVSVLTMYIKCENCDQTFSVNSFDAHICEYSDRDTFIYDDEMMRFLWEESALRKLYEHNNHKIEDILGQCGNDEDVRSNDFDEPINQTNHACGICHRIYTHASSLARHMNARHNSISHNKTVRRQNNQNKIMTEVIKCLFCDRIFSSLSLCLVHLKNCFNKNENYSLNHDAMLFETIQLNQCFQCEFCDFMFADASDLLEHEMTHDLSVGYECNSCAFTSRTLKVILNHRQHECNIKIAEKQMKIGCKLCFACSDCESTFKTLTQLYEHRYKKKHYPRLFNHASQQKEYFCEKCGEIFGIDWKAFELHIKLNHAEKDTITAAKRPYLCDLCGKGYTQSSHLYQHLRFHNGIKPFECPTEGCNRRFTIRPDLNDHIRKFHTKERPYNCDVCGKSFLTGSVFYQHRLIHRNERRYGCETCEKRFHRSDALKNHQRIHSGEKPYACSACSKTFRQKGDRDKHFRTRHRKNLNESM